MEMKQYGSDMGLEGGSGSEAGGGERTPASILIRCEADGPAHPYAVGGGEDPHILLHNVKGKEVVVVSDLHLASGLDRDRRYAGTENFFNDEAFARFLDHMRGETAERGGTLVINGDFVDFMRIIDYPDSPEAFDEWSRMLADLGIDRDPTFLRESIIPKEKEYGLRTQEYKSVWRLYRSMAGHELLFRGLARWMAAEGNELVILKGNHDLEWYWLGVRNALRLELARMVAEIRGIDLQQSLLEEVLPNLYFIDDALLIDNDLYIEHGHRYDRFTYVLGEPAKIYDQKRKEEELNIPFGSFFNRYLFNRLEGAYPFIDNIRPRENVLPLVIRERFPLALNLIFRHILFLFRMLGKEKRYLTFMFGRVLLLLIVILLPVAFLLLALTDDLSRIVHLGSSTDGATSSGILTPLFEGFKYIGGLVLSYILARLVAWLQLEEPASLEGPARKILGNIEYRFATMGHTHDPDQFQVEDRWFYNTGTWIPIVSVSSADLRSDRIYTFLHLYRHPESGRLASHPLQCWNDSAGRPELLTILRKPVTEEK